MELRTPEDQKAKDEQDVVLANAGKQVLNNVAYKNAMMLRKAQIFELFCKTKHDQPEEREEAWRTMMNINALEDYFNVLLTTGKMAEHSLQSTKQE